ncbi:unnamed protein product [Caenorhabditis angaria]|uniref:RNA polymerase II-associated protein 1 N-terminal domain-containing protein n=1 Tax=Caenorhabditis angaria TaxID=860376 RepID=A0A9P1INL7_9PELO|nr:unnamed protein product [Caenorhabditis angaria]
MDSGMFPKRPNFQETDEDLLKMQEEFEMSKNKKSVEIHRMKKRNPSQNNQPTKKAGRFTIELDDIREESDAQGILFPIRERNNDWLNSDKRDEIIRNNFSSFNFSKDDGFPESLDLSSYYLNEPGTSKRLAQPGKSFFATEFDRIHGNMEENLDFAREIEESEEISKDQGDFEAENESYLKSLDMEKINELKQEIQERLDPKLIDFLANRRKNMQKKDGKIEEKPKISKFKARKLAEKSIGKPQESQEPKEELQNPPEPKEEDKSAEQQQITIQDMLNELEVLDEFKNREDREKYDRLATDAIQLDLTAKFGRNVVSRQQKNALRLFENCKLLPNDYDGNDKLIELARSSIGQIQNLYLEEIESSGHRSFEFAKGLNPIIDNCWTLIPVRRVLDAVEKRHGQVLEDDVEIPNEIYIHLSEVFLIGPEILADDVIVECCERIEREYIVKSAEECRISIRMNAKIAGLDAFMPFYENMLKNYEQYSLGNVQFARSILIAAYLNTPIGDSIEYRFSLWTPKRKIIRQMTISNQNATDILPIIKKQIEENEKLIDEQFYVQYCSLLGAYVGAIRDEIVTKNRNELMWEIASFEIGRFMKRFGQNKGDLEKLRQFELLADIIRKSIGDKLVI